MADGRQVFRARLIGSIIALMFVVLLARLWQLQVVRGGEYLEDSLNNRIRMEKLPSTRGIIYDRNGEPVVRNTPYYFVSVLPEMIAKVDVRRVADFLHIEPDGLAETLHGNRDSLETVRIKGGLAQDEVAYVAARLSEYPSLIIEAEESRQYIHGQLASHLIGYLGKLNPQQARQEKYSDVPRESFIGQWGVERKYDELLRGEPGERIYEVDALGRKLRMLSVVQPTRGSDLYLSMDLGLQRTVEKTLEGRVGAVVAIKPNTGEVLALVSMPTFDPNLFSRGIDYDDWVGLTEDTTYPMLNRALQSSYPPGSTFKIITAMAALEENDIAPYTEFRCTGVHAVGPWKFRCWNRSGHGRVDLYDAIVQSCDIYFYLAGEYTGIDNIAKYARLFGLGRATGLDIVSERTGLVPDTEWKRRVKGEKWFLGETYNAAIGQGFELATPAQLAKMISMVANGGREYELSLRRLDAAPEPLSVVHLNEHNMRQLRRALVGVVSGEHGTGAAAAVAHLRVAGKTGTAQVVKLPEEKKHNLPQKLRDHALFVGYAPADDPEIALSVIVEHGGGGGAVAAPVAREAFAAYMAERTAHAGD